MARADLLLNLVKAGVSGERELLVRTTQALIAEEHVKTASCTSRISRCPTAFYAEECRYHERSELKWTQPRS
jgi:hypothetical protein